MHPDNYGHRSGSVDAKRFKLFENDDQKFWEEVAGGKEPDPPKEVAGAAPA